MFNSSDCVNLLRIGPLDPRVANRPDLFGTVPNSDAVSRVHG